MFKILFAATILRIINLNQSLWLDETISAIAVQDNSFLDLITKFAPGDVHPPLYYLILKLWTNIFGYSEVALRLPSVIFGVLTVFVVYKIGGKIFNPRVGALAAIFIAVNPLAVYYSQEARMYSLTTFAVATAVYFFLTKKLFWYLFFLLVAIYSDYVPLLLLPVFLPSSLLIFIFLLPWLPVVWSQFQTSIQLAQTVPLWGKVVGGFSFKALILTPIKFIFGRIPSHPLMIFLIAFYIWIVTRVQNRFLWFWLLVPIILGAILSLKIPIFTYHRFLFVLPPLVILLAAGSIKNKLFMGLIFLVSFISLLIFNLNPAFQRENWRDGVKYMQNDPGTALIPNLSQSSSISYYDENYPVFDKSNFTLNYQTPIYLFRYVQEIFDPDDLERNLLEIAGYKNVEQKNFNGVVIWKYVF